MADGHPGQQIGLPWLSQPDQAAITQKEVSRRDRAFLCRAAADAIQKHIQAKQESAKRSLAMPPTRRRHRMAEEARNEAMRLEGLQRTLYRLAEMHDEGTVPRELADLTSRAAVERALFQGVERTAIRQLYEDVKRSENESERVSRLEAEALLMGIPGFVATPTPLATELVTFADIRGGCAVLEPSAGIGYLIDAIRRQHPNANISFCEVNARLREILSLKYKGNPNVEELASDFTLLDPRLFSQRFDAVIMNPPFERAQDIDHILHAYPLLAPGGVLAAIVSEGAFQRSDKKAQGFRQFLETEKAAVRIAPADAFKVSGTSVFCRLIRIQARHKRTEEAGAVISISSHKNRPRSLSSEAGLVVASRERVGPSEWIGA